MTFNPQAPPVYKPTSQKVAAPPIYRPQQASNSSAQLKPAANFRTETRPAPPVYRPQQASAPTAQLKAANNFRPETRPAPVYTIPQATGRPFAPPPSYRAAAPAVAQGKEPVAVYKPAPPPVYKPFLTEVSQAKATVVGSPRSSINGVKAVNQSVADLAVEAQRNVLSPSLNTVQAASGPIRSKRGASRDANVKMGLDARGSHRARERRQVAPYNVGPEGKYGIVLFTFRGAKKRGLNPGSRYVRKVTIDYTGNRAGDYAAAGGAAPAGQVWHHYHNYNPATNRGTMYLMTVADHAPSHYGGVWMYEQAHGVVYG